jgi:ribonuclease HI
MSYEIFTDGSSRGNPGPGGWGTIIIDLQTETVREFGGFEPDTTNNRMEITAAIEALSRLVPGDEGKIFTDSSYLINGATKWLHGWKRNGWISSTKKDIMNRDLWMKLDEVMKEKNFKWIYVGGHAGIAGNERCDVIATSLATNDRLELYSGELNKYPILDIRDVSQKDEGSASRSPQKKINNGKAYSYVSLVDKEIVIDKTWAECEKRVKGKSGARFKKSFSPSDEASIVREFSAK